jgi:hypothetical protein
MAMKQKREVDVGRQFCAVCELQGKQTVAQYDEPIQGGMWGYVCQKHHRAANDKVGHKLKYYPIGAGCEAD